MCCDDSFFNDPSCRVRKRSSRTPRVISPMYMHL
ncbi:unnamed protein product [Tenebrio molitor]|nr:unnamed protein product [Tenebrio molitor]